MKISEEIKKRREKDIKAIKDQVEEVAKSDFVFKKTWPLGFISFLGFPSLVNMLTGKEFSHFLILTLFALVFFIPERRKKKHLEITQDEINYYKKNPDEIALINNATKIRYKYLSYAFILGFILVVISKLVGPMFAPLISSFWSDVMKDLSFELGVALWGGAITTYIIELHAKREEEDCKYKQDMLRKLIDLNDEEVV